MALCDLDCRQARPREKAYRLTDSKGLYLDVMPSGSRVWRLRYHFQGREKLLTLGMYPTLSLAVAREKRDLARIAVGDGVDPSFEKKEQKRLARFQYEQTFEVVAREWHTQNVHLWTPNYGKHVLSRLVHNAFPFIGKYPVNTLTVQQILVCLQKVEERERYDMAHRMLQIIGQVMRYAVVTGRAERDITTDLKGALKKYRKGHYAAIDASELPDLVRAVERNEPRLYRQTILAVKLMLLTFVRTSELINATWDEFDLNKAVWNIPAERMKMRNPHRVPLSRQVIEILNELRERFGGQGYILPGIISHRKPISNNTVLKALERLGYRKKMTGHGFRALAMSTIKEKLGYRHEVVDRQLAHVPRNKVDRAYDRAQFLEERTVMMQVWADYVSSLLHPDSKECLALTSNRNNLPGYSYTVVYHSPSRQ